MDKQEFPVQEVSGFCDLCLSTVLKLKPCKLRAVGLGLKQSSLHVHLALRLMSHLSVKQLSLSACIAQCMSTK